MDPQILFLIVQASTIIMLVMVLLALRMAFSVWRTLRGRRGGELARVTMAILGAFAMGQIVIVVNTFSGLTKATTDAERQLAYGVVQWIVIVVAVWGYRRLSRLG